uniref:Fibronectin type-II domain-containing protein n=1 Tax=Lotharella globosa TaxID=91324 RepID=A0A7S3Z6H2_9EUKA
MPNPRLFLLAFALTAGGSSKDDVENRNTRKVQFPSKLRRTTTDPSTSSPSPTLDERTWIPASGTVTLLDSKCDIVGYEEDTEQVFQHPPKGVSSRVGTPYDLTEFKDRLIFDGPAKYAWSVTLQNKGLQAATVNVMTYVSTDDDIIEKTDAKIRNETLELPPGKITTYAAASEDVAQWRNTAYVGVIWIADCERNNSGSMLAGAITVLPTTTASSTLRRTKSNATHCYTTQGELCHLPFTYKGVTYTSCTDEDAAWPWCALGPGSHTRV